MAGSLAVAGGGNAGSSVGSNRGGPLGETRSVLASFVVAFLFGGCLTFLFARHLDWESGGGGGGGWLGRELPKLGDDSHHGHVLVDDSNRVSLRESETFKGHTHAKELGQDVLADALYNKVRILCWIMTSPQNLRVKTVHVQATWTRRCNKVVFISSEDNPSFPTVKVEAKEGREYLWVKTRGAFTHVYRQHLQEADWFLKADDDTYVVLENLRYLLADKDPNQPLYYGRKFKPFVKQGYMSGGAGYVLSRAALVLAVEKAFTDPKICRSEATAFKTAEDVEMGKCLANVGVVAGDSRDEAHRDRFHPFVPEHHLVPGVVPKKFWYWNYVYYPTEWGPNCCSDYSISFHYISPNSMYLLEYMIYHMRPFGIGHYTCPANMGAILSQLGQGSAQQQPAESAPKEAKSR